MATDISASTVKVVTSSGEKTYYSFDIVDPKTGQIKEAFNTTNPQEAKAFYDKSAAKYPSATTNGKSESPFEDGTFKAQTDYKVGGFAGPASEAGPDLLLLEKTQAFPILRNSQNWREIYPGCQKPAEENMRD